jgi:cytochrome c oxidase subunit 2
MPAALRRLLIAASAPAMALVLAGTAAADNAGFTPPDSVSPNGHAINQAYYIVMGVTVAVFLLVETLLVVFMIRFRSRGRDRTVEGPQIHGHHRLELIWTVIPVVLLAVIVTFVFVKLPVIKNEPASANALKVRVEGRQFYWRFVYPSGAVSLDRMVVPTGRTVSLDIVSPDVNHSFWVPQFGPKTDAIPGHPNTQWFKVDKVGVYEGHCAEFCGIQHAMMLFNVDVREPNAYRSWAVSQRRLLSKPSVELGKQEFESVCAKCHHLATSGDQLIGPNIGGNPTLTDPAALGLLVRNGRGKMPPVGKGWSTVEVQSLVRYFGTQSSQGQQGEGPENGG